MHQTNYLKVSITPKKKGKKMKQFYELAERIIMRVNMNLRTHNFIADEYIELVDISKFMGSHSFYGVSSSYPIYFTFKHSSMSGSYLLGKCVADHSLIYKSDIRGDELKRKGETFVYGDQKIPIKNDEVIYIRDSFLIKTLVHSCSHNPESPEQFLIRNTIAMHYANIHGAITQGCFLGAFATIDLSHIYSSIIGDFSYVQAEHIFSKNIEPGTIYIKNKKFEFNYKFSKKVLNKYIKTKKNKKPEGVFIDFIESRKIDMEKLFEGINHNVNFDIPENSNFNQYAVARGEIHIGENVLVSQRAYLDNAWLGEGANAQENSYIINSHLSGYDITAHGAKIINAFLEEKVFVGFNSFIHGIAGSTIKIGTGTIIMPHTIIDIKESLEIKENLLVWGYIQNKKDLEENSISLNDLEKIKDGFKKGSLKFSGSGKAFVVAFKNRIEHILEANGAFEKQGHAQGNRNISFNALQPYLIGEKQGLYPTMDIRE